VGIAVEDELVRDVILQAAVDRGGCCCELGGDEFAFLREGFFSDRIEADFGENSHTENVSLFGVIESLLSGILTCSAAFSGDLSNPHFAFKKTPAFCLAHTCFGIPFAHE
jgi:hypothetical protein